MPDGNFNPEDLQKSFDELAEVVTAQREEVEKGDKKSEDTLKTIEEAIEEKAQVVSDMQVAFKAATDETEAQKSRIENLEQVISEGAYSKGGDTDKPKRTKLDDMFGEYMRKGDANGTMLGDGDNAMASRDFINEVGEAIIKSELYSSDERLQDMARKELVVGVNPMGGYFITPDMRGRIEGRIFETSPMRGLSNIITTTNESVEFVLDDNEAESGWVGEVDARPETATPDIAQIIIPTHEQYAKPKASQKMLDDAGFDIEQWLINKVSDRFTRRENTAFVSGDGSKKPKGFLSFAAAADPDVYERYTIGQQETAASGVIDGDDLKDLQNLLKQDYQGNATWGMKRSTWATITKLKDTQNRYLFELLSNLRDGDILQILGRPVVLMDDMPAISANTLSVVYADFRRSYTIVDRIGVRVLRDPFSNKPFIEFYTTKRVGGEVTNFDSIKLMKIKA